MRSILILATILFYGCSAGSFIGQGEEKKTGKLLVTDESGSTTRIPYINEIIQNTSGQNGNSGVRSNGETVSSSNTVKTNNLLLKIVSAESSYNAASEKVTLKIKVVDANSIPRAGVGVLFNMAAVYANSYTKPYFKTVHYFGTEVITDADGIAKASERVAGGNRIAVSSETLPAWRVVAILDRDRENPYIVLPGGRLEMGKAYTHNWMNKEECSGNVLKLTIANDGTPSALPATIAAGTKIKALFLPTAAENVSCMVNDLLVLYDDIDDSIYNEEHNAAAVNRKCGTNSCWKVVGSTLTAWASGTNEAATGQNWIMRYGNQQRYIYLVVR